MRSNIVVIYFFIVVTTLHANNSVDVVALASKLNLFAGTKATVQWERVFSSDRRMKKYHLDTLASDKLYQLKIYLIEHAADSDQPIVPGL